MIRNRIGMLVSVAVIVMALAAGAAPAAESYLNIDRIIEVAREAKADAIHPGYGFLAENAEFARRVIDEGILWVGPPPDAIATMGDKIASRKAAAGAKVDGVPGTVEPLESVEEARAARERLVAEGGA